MTDNPNRQSNLEILKDALHMEYGALHFVWKMIDDLKRKALEISTEIDDIKRRIDECLNDR